MHIYLSTKRMILTIVVLLLPILTACVVASTPTPTPSPGPPLAAPPQVADAMASIPAGEDRRLMFALIDAPASEASTALEQIVDSGDRRYIPVLIELLRAAEIGLDSANSYRAYVAALEDLSGQSFGADWPAWVEWYGKTDLQPPPGFTAWKGQILSGIDPEFGNFLYEQAPSRIRVEEIQWGGVVVDGIPALDNPRFIPGDQEEYLAPEDAVFGITIHGDSRAYPLRILDWHEMANDVVGGVPVSLAYCTLCGAGIAYDGRASDGVTYTFGSSGFLYRSNKLMYDRQTRSLWNQLTGEPVLGKLAEADVRLSLLPVVLTSWGEWLSQHPDTVVLSLETGYPRLYEPGAAYAEYFASDQTMFPVWQRSSQLPDKARVYAMILDGVPKAYPLEALVAEEVVNDQVGQTSLVLVARRGIVQVQGYDLRSLLASKDEGGTALTYESGGEVRAYKRGEQVFLPGPDPDTLLDEGGRAWKVTEEALLGPDGQTAPRIPGHLAYWFGWFAFFPNTLVY